VVLQPPGELVFGVVQGERVERGRGAGGLALQGHESLALIRGEALVVPYGGELGLEDCPADLVGGPPRRGRGVVELVGQAGGELAQGGEFLVLAVGPLRVAHAPGQARDEDVGHLGQLDGHAPEGLRVDLEDAARLAGPRPVNGRPTRQHSESAGELAGPVGPDGDLLLAVEARNPHFTLEQDVEAVDDGVLIEEVVSGLHLEFSAVGQECLELTGRKGLLLPRILRRAHHAPASLRRSLLPASTTLSGPSTGSRTWKQVSPGLEATWISPP
jgi:hypothetical protein